MPPENRSTLIAGSYRDPAGYVFTRQGRVFRAIDADCRHVLDHLDEAGIWTSLLEDGGVVPTWTVEDAGLLASLRAEHPRFEHFLEHEVLDTLTYPYEWTVSMLADAGQRTLDLQLRLLEAKCALKDATAFNVQFAGPRPVFIDAGSFERPQRMDVWFALGQFMQMFLFPLLLCRYRAWDLASYFRANLNGRPIEAVARSFGRLGRLRPALLMDLTLPLWLHRWAEKRNRARREVLERRRENPKAQILNLQRLRRKIARLASGYRPAGVWSEYTRICNYDTEAEQDKKRRVAEFLDETQPSRVLDLGCNTGDYSRLAADAGAEVLAVDSDHDAVELLYRQLQTDPAPITPMVVDLANPSPALGHLNAERPAFFERAQADCVLALALVHHLLVSANMPLSGICELLARLTRRDLVLEFVPRHDDMFQRLMKFRVDLFGDLDLAACRNAFAERFELLRESPIAGSKRMLLFLRKRAAVS